MADMKYVQMTLDDWMALKGRLEMELKASAAGFVRIGYILRKIKDSEGYRNEGYDSLTEWAKDNYGLSASTVSRFMAINKKYSIDGYGEQLKLEYAEFGSAKLAEMLALPDADLEMVSPEMKKEDIREIKKFNKEVAKEEPPAIEEVDVKTEPAIAEEQTPEQAAPEVPNMLPEHKWIFEFFRENKLMEINNLYNVNIPPVVKGFRITSQGGPYYSDDFPHVEGDLYRPMGKPVWEDSFNDALDTDATIHGYITVTPLQLDRTNRAVFNSLQQLNP